MVVYGYPTKHQTERSKPGRLSPELVVQRDRYRDPRPDQLRREILRVNRIRREESGFAEFVRAFHDRKYASDFVREMNRSAEGYLREFL